MKYMKYKQLTEIYCLYTYKSKSRRGKWVHSVPVQFPPEFEVGRAEKGPQSDLHIKKRKTFKYIHNNTKTYLPQIEITANTTQVVHSGIYLMKTSAIRAAMKIR